MRPVVVFDIDGVLADFTWGFSGLLEGKNRSQGTQPTWQYEKASSFQVSQAWKYIDTSKTFWQGLPPIVTESEAHDVCELAKQFSVIYMTGREDRGNDTLGQTERWLRSMEMPKGEVILRGDKANAIHHLELDVVGIIDDKPDTLVSLFQEGHPVYARDWAYNRWVAEVPRVSSVGEFIYLVGQGAMVA